MFDQEPVLLGADERPGTLHLLAEEGERHLACLELGHESCVGLVPIMEAEDAAFIRRVEAGIP